MLPKILFCICTVSFVPLGGLRMLPISKHHLWEFVVVIFFLIPLAFIIKQFYQLQRCFFLFLSPILEVAHLGGHRTLFCNISKLFWSFLVRCSKAYFAASISIQSKFFKENWPSVCLIYTTSNVYVTYDN